MLLRRRTCESDKVDKRAVESEDTAGENTVGGGAAFFNLHGEPAQLVFAVGHAGGAHSVRYEDGAVGTLGAPPELHHLRRVVDAVADDFGVEGSVVRTVPRMPGSR